MRPEGGGSRHRGHGDNHSVPPWGVSGFFCVSKRRVAWRYSQGHGMGGTARRPQAAGGDVRAGPTSQGLCRQSGGSGTGSGRTRIREPWLSAETPSSSPHWLPEEPDGHCRAQRLTGQENRSQWAACSGRPCTISSHALGDGQEVLEGRGRLFAPRRGQSCPRMNAGT